MTLLICRSRSGVCFRRLRAASWRRLRAAMLRPLSERCLSPRNPAGDQMIKSAFEPGPELPCHIAKMIARISQNRRHDTDFCVSETVRKLVGIFKRLELIFVAMAAGNWSTSRRLALWKRSSKRSGCRLPAPDTADHKDRRRRSHRSLRPRRAGPHRLRRHRQPNNLRRRHLGGDGEFS